MCLISGIICFLQHIISTIFACVYSWLIICFSQHSVDFLLKLLILTPFYMSLNHFGNKAGKMKRKDEQFALKGQRQSGGDITLPHGKMSSRCNLQVCRASFFPAITIRYCNILRPGIFLIQIWYRMSEAYPFEIKMIFPNIWKKAPFKTLYLPVSSADNLCKQFVSRSGQTKHRA